MPGFSGSLGRSPLCRFCPLPNSCAPRTGCTLCKTLNTSHDLDYLPAFCGPFKPLHFVRVLSQNSSCCSCADQRKFSQNIGRPGQLLILRYFPGTFGATQRWDAWVSLAISRIPWGPEKTAASCSAKCLAKSNAINWLLQWEDSPCNMNKRAGQVILMIGGALDHEEEQGYVH